MSKRKNLIERLRSMPKYVKCLVLLGIFVFGFAITVAIGTITHYMPDITILSVSTFIIVAIAVLDPQ